MARLTHVAVMASLLAALNPPRAATAAHRFDLSELDPAASQLHLAVQRFEQLACSRQLPPHEIHYIRLMTKKACRLLEGVQCAAPWGRIRADYHVVAAFARTVDRRLARHCHLRYDRPLSSSWNCVQQSLADVRCLTDSAPGRRQHYGQYRSSYAPLHLAGPPHRPDLNFFHR